MRRPWREPTDPLPRDAKEGSEPPEPCPDCPDRADKSSSIHECSLVVQGREPSSEGVCNASLSQRFSSLNPHLEAGSQKLKVDHRMMVHDTGYFNRFTVVTLGQQELRFQKTFEGEGVSEVPSEVVLWCLGRGGSEDLERGRRITTSQS